MKLENLYELAENEKINIQKTSLKDLNGLYVNIDDEPFIVLRNNYENEKEEKVVLAEELAHHFCGVIPTPPFSNDYYNKLVRSKNEFKAFKWCVNKLMPLDTIKSFFRKDALKYEVAEELGLTEDFVHKAFELYIDNLKEIY